jgi:tetratricopeptide (TPR) repeat protein
MPKLLALFLSLSMLANFSQGQVAFALDKTQILELLPSDEAKLQRVFRSAFFPKEKYCTLEFKRHGDGTYSQEQVVSSTGIKSLDTACIAALNMALPFTRFDGPSEDFYMAVAQFKFAPTSCEVTLRSPGIVSPSRVDQLIARKKNERARNIKIVETRIQKALPQLGNNNPKLWQSYQFLANEQLELGNLAQAENNIQKAIKCQEKTPLSGELALSKSDLAQILLQKGQPEEAEKTFKEVISMQNLAQTKNSNYLLNLERYAKFLFKAGKLDQAQEIYNKIKEIKLAKTVQESK